MQRYYVLEFVYWVYRYSPTAAVPLVVWFQIQHNFPLDGDLGFLFHDAANPTIGYLDILNFATSNAHPLGALTITYLRVLGDLGANQKIAWEATIVLSSLTTSILLKKTLAALRPSGHKILAHLSPLTLLLIPGVAETFFSQEEDSLSIVLIAGICYVIATTKAQAPGYGIVLMVCVASLWHMQISIGLCIATCALYLISKSKFHKIAFQFLLGILISAFLQLVFYLAGFYKWLEYVNNQNNLVLNLHNGISITTWIRYSLDFGGYFLGNFNNYLYCLSLTALLLLSSHNLITLETQFVYKILFFSFLLFNLLYEPNMPERWAVTGYLMALNFLLIGGALKRQLNTTKILN